MEACKGVNDTDGIAVIALGDPRYPPLLKHIADPPARLFVRGDASLPARRDAVAVVGTRKMTRYGETCAGRIGAALATAGATVVSGLALGIDAAAHEAAIDAGGACVAVLAAGVSDGDIGPRTNFGLAMRILRSGGALISEFPPGTPAARGMFPLRNRIVAGMSRATVIVEAATKSGALITARLALEGGRDVYAVPGPITSPASEGTNDIIAKGAAPVVSVPSLLGSLGYAAKTRPERADLTDDERAVLGRIAAGADSPDEIAAATGLEPRRVAAALSSLAIKGASTGSPN